MFIETSILVMPLRSSRFYLSGCLHYYGHIRLPRSRSRRCVGDPTFMRYLILSRNHILPRIFLAVLFIVNSSKMTGFIIYERLANIGLCNEA